MRPSYERILVNSPVCDKSKVRVFTTYSNSNDTFYLMASMNDETRIIAETNPSSKLTVHQPYGQRPKVLRVRPHYDEAMRINRMVILDGGHEAFTVSFPNDEFSVRHWDSEFLYAEFKYYEYLVKSKDFNAEALFEDAGSSSEGKPFSTSGSTAPQSRVPAEASTAIPDTIQPPQQLA